MSKKRIGFNIPSTVGSELSYMKNAIVGKHISGSGKYTEKCNKILENKFSLKKSFDMNFTD